MRIWAAAEHTFDLLFRGELHEPRAFAEGSLRFEGNRDFCFATVRLTASVGRSYARLSGAGDISKIDRLSVIALYSVPATALQAVGLPPLISADEEDAWPKTAVALLAGLHVICRGFEIQHLVQPDTAQTVSFPGLDFPRFHGHG